METITLVDLAPILAAIIGPMLLFGAATMRYQHVDSIKTRELTHELIGKNSELNERAHAETRDLIDKNREDSDRAHAETRERSDRAHKATRKLIDKNHRELSSSLGDVRERVSRIEGHLRGPPPPTDETADGDAEAA
ncbi:hypothetical protein [Candidatus Poriferisodalis sp.]|uniref:hypothetical protein n=1 Tax=Candidatus Poriferisodalis sp. TaxID=3101277 RepID=UPI003B5A373F